MAGQNIGLKYQFRQHKHPCHSYLSSKKGSRVMPHIRLIHWNQTEAKQKAQILQSAGYTVNREPLTPQNLKELKNNMPDAIVIDLTRLPMQGRDIAITIRHDKATRNVPIIFVEGDSQKLARIKTQLPDAKYTDYNQIQTILKQTLAHPPKVAVVPTSIFEQYKDTPLTKKLGIKPKAIIALINPPLHFIETLGELPKGTIITTISNEKPDIVIWFTKTRKDLETNIAKIATRLTPAAKLWIAWPKKQAAEIATGLTQATVRKTSLSHGLVDYKICAINKTWSALLFTKRKAKPPIRKPI
jgi:CheY-like chemotaxis protein